MDDVIPGLAGRLILVDDGLAREFEERVLESSTLAVRVAYSVLRHREDAEDIAQEAFAKAYRSFHQLRDRDRFRAWLVRMTWRLALDRQRADRRRVVREGAYAVPVAQTMVEVIAAHERAERLWHAIDTLPEKLRLVIVLASIEGHDGAEVGRLLRVPVGTVKSRLFEARRRLKEKLGWI